MNALMLSIKLALVTTFILLIFCAPLALMLSESKSRLSRVFLSVASLPLVLPPTVLGFYLLIIFSPNNFLGEFLARFNIKLVFNFPALVVASVIYSLPFMLNPLVSAMNALPKALFERCYLLEKGFLNRLFFIILPNIKNALLSAIAMCFAHTMGEFGVVMMVGGSREGETKVASIAIYEALENLDYASAHKLSLMILAISLVILVITQYKKH